MVKRARRSQHQVTRAGDARFAGLAGESGGVADGGPIRRPDGGAFREFRNREENDDYLGVAAVLAGTLVFPAFAQEEDDEPTCVLGNVEHFEDGIGLKDEFRLWRFDVCIANNCEDGEYPGHCEGDWRIQSRRVCCMTPSSVGPCPMRPPLLAGALQTERPGGVHLAHPSMKPQFLHFPESRRACAFP